MKRNINAPEHCVSVCTVCGLKSRPNTTTQGCYSDVRCFWTQSNRTPTIEDFTDKIGLVVTIKSNHLCSSPVCLLSQLHVRKYLTSTHLGLQTNNKALFTHCQVWTSPFPPSICLFPKLLSTFSTFLSCEASSYDIHDNENSQISFTKLISWALVEFS